MRTVKRLPASAPRGSLRVWGCASSTSKSAPRACAQSTLARGRGTENHCTATARRSLSPAKPTSAGRQPAIRASSRATHCVLASRLRTLNSTCAPVPAGAKPRSSSTTKSSGCARKAPCARGGARATSRALRTGADEGLISPHSAVRPPVRQCLRRARESPALRWSSP